MSIAYKQILSLGTSHDPSQYMAEIGCRTSTQARNTWFGSRQNGTHSEHRYRQWPERKQLLIKMAQIILLGLIQHTEDVKKFQNAK